MVPELGVLNGARLGNFCLSCLSKKGQIIGLAAPPGSVVPSFCPSTRVLFSTAWNALPTAERAARRVFTAGESLPLRQERRSHDSDAKKSPVVFTRGVSVFHVLRGTKAVLGGS